MTGVGDSVVPAAARARFRPWQGVALRLQALRAIAPHGRNGAAFAGSYVRFRRAEILSLPNQQP